MVSFGQSLPSPVDGENAQRDSRIVKEMHLRNDITPTSRGKKTKEGKLQEQPGSRSEVVYPDVSFMESPAVSCTVRCAHSSPYLDSRLT